MGNVYLARWHLGCYLMKKGSIPLRSKYIILAGRLRSITVSMLKSDFKNVIIKYYSGNINNTTSMLATMTSPNTYVAPERTFNFNKLKTNAKKYINTMANKSTWGGQLELKKLCIIVQQMGFKGIVVLQNDNNIVTEIAGMKFTKNRSNAPVIHIILSDVNRGGLHFNFVNKTK